MFKSTGSGLFILLLLLGYPLFSFFKPSLAKADISSCQASMVAHAVSPNSGNSFTIHITNTDSNNINWVKISRPSGNFTILSNSSSGWNDSNTPAFAYESDNTLAPGNNMDVTISVQSANVQADPAGWIVETSDVANQNPFACSGNLDMAISGDIVDVTPPNIYNVSANSLSTTSVKIAWSTDELSDSRVNYGPDSSYGSSTDVDSAMVSQHSVTLTGLSSDTGYHYQVVSADASGNSAGSSDSTFLTSEKTAPAAKTIDAPGLAVQVTNPGDKTPPAITLNPVPANHIYKTAPTLSGIANDESAVARVEYSTDGGRNWLPVDSAPNIGGKQVNFSFTPTNLDDGNYNLLARAIDQGGNVSATPAIEIIIDRLPPLVGGDLIYIGPQILEPSQSGVIGSVVGVDQKITLSAVGGPTSINLSAVSKNSKLKTKDFALTRSPDTGLWSGILSFEEPGTYTITADSVDGAGSKASRELNTIQVSPAGKVIDTKTKKPVAAAVSVYYLQPDSNDWVVWDGAPYGQTNPQKTGQDGQFNLFLPAGKYYLKASAKGYQNLHSDIFELKQSMPISTNLNIKPADLKLGPLNISWPDFSAQPISLTAGSKDLGANSLIGKTLPEFKLSSTSGGQLNSVDLLGKPTVLSFMTTWSPTASEQLGSLAKLQSDKDINVVPVGLQENAGKVRTYSEISGYSLNWLADPDSTLSDSFNPRSLPTHYFIDRTGVVKQVISGVLTKQQILNDLSGL